MIVYGDPGYKMEFSVLLAQLEARAASIYALVQGWIREGAANEDALDALRSLLIFAGQVEQAVEDAAPEKCSAAEWQGWRSRCRAWTDAAAAAFVATLSLPELQGGETVSASIECLTTGHLDGVFPLREEIAAVLLNVKLPEGFAFYGLYPERYAESAGHWAAEQKPPPDETIFILGVRSIGTSLSALVTAALNSQGRQAIRCTVRPTGHPYTRQVDLTAEQSVQARGAAWALIADEGPGMSGSSMAATAQALADAGMKSGRIAFLPGHGGEPGGQGSETTRHLWATTPRYATPPAAMRWNGSALSDILAARTSALYGGGVRAVRVEEVGGGLWRRTAYAGEQEWPAVCPAFERPKYLCTLENGDRIVWKFAGLATGADGRAQDESLFHLLTERSRAGWTPAPLDRSMGFVALPWLTGTPLTRTDADADTLRHIARYLAAVSGLPLTTNEHHTAIARLADMLYWNTWEALGEEAAARTRQWSEAAASSDWITRARTYGDGHLAPHEWLRTPTGELFNTDCDNHATDHTIVGKQCYVWDVAGAIVEWQMDNAAETGFTAATQQATGDTFPVHALTFYRLAYAAFRIGQTAHCARISGHDPNEQARLWRSHELYKSALLTALPP